MKRLTIKHLATLTAVLLLSVPFISCGGGGSDDDPLVNLTAVFAGDDPAGIVGMAAGSSSGEDFEIQVSVSGINDLFGAAFRMYFDDSSAAFVGWDGSNSILTSYADLNDDLSTDFRASLVAPGEIAVFAALTGNGEGVDIGSREPLITLSFRATAGTSENRFRFSTENPPSEVSICPTAGQDCHDAIPSSITWTGGTLMVTQ